MGRIQLKCGCQIVPPDVLARLAQDATVADATRQGLVNTAAMDAELRKMRSQARTLLRAAEGLAPAGLTAALAPAPAITVFDCQHTRNLPGSPVARPGQSSDASVRSAHDETQAVADFFSQVFGRNSIDDGGMTLMSSVHFGANYNNALWNGLQMIYGDGDGQIFVDFTRGRDVIAHELTHGVTQHTLRLVYANEPGGLNESMSDVFGSMFRQWRAGQDVNAADWLIGADILGPLARGRGFTCLRDMANPAAGHCLSPQIAHYSQYAAGMDPHHSSGVPNLAFQRAAVAVGGRSWDRVGQIWYKAMTGGRSPQMRMAAFANRTRQIARRQFPAEYGAVDAAWTQVGL